MRNGIIDTIQHIVRPWRAFKITLMPDMAKALLSASRASRKDRPIRRGRVALYRRLARDNKWMFNGEPIVPCLSGSLP